MRILLFLLFFTAYSALSKPAQIDQLITLLPFEKSLKEEVNTEKVKPHEGVPLKELEIRESIWYLKDSETPYTGKVYSLHPNGQKKQEGNFKEGKLDGLYVEWYENGQKAVESNMKNGKPDGVWVNWHENGRKKSEINWKDGIKVEGSAKYWNSKGEPVATYKEAINIK